MIRQWVTVAYYLPISLERWEAMATREREIVVESLNEHIPDAASPEFMR